MGQVRYRSLFQQIRNLSANVFPLVVQGTWGVFIALRKAQHASPNCLLSIGSRQQVLECDLIRRAGQLISAAQALERSDNSLPDQSLQDLPQEGHGDFFGSRYFSGTEDGACGLLCQERNGPDGVFGGMRKNHLTRLPYPVGMDTAWPFLSADFSHIRCAKNHTHA